MSKGSRKVLFAGIAFVFVSSAVWLIARSPETPQQPAISDDGSRPKTMNEPPAESTTTKDNAGEAMSRTDLESSIASDTRSFDDQIAELRKLSTQDRFSRIRPILRDFIADLISFNALQKADYKSCLEKTIAKSALNDCFSDWEAENSIMGSIAVEDVLSKLPNFSEQTLLRDNEHWFLTLDQEQSKAEKLMLELGNDPQLAQKLGITVGALDTIVSMAKAYEQQAVLSKDDDPVASTILIHHADLLYADFTWRTWAFTEATYGGRPNK
jgi:hypothetical protein